jgi:hypothetical protein
MELKKQFDVPAASLLIPFTRIRQESRWAPESAWPPYRRENLSVLSRRDDSSVTQHAIVTTLINNCCPSVTIYTYVDQSKSSRSSSTAMIWRAVSSCSLDWLLLVISAYRFCRGCRLQLVEAARQVARTVTIMHWHTSLVVRQFFAEENIPTISQTSSYPDFASSDV